MNLVELVLHFYRMLSSGVYTWGEMLTLIADILREIAKLFPDGLVGLQDAQAQASLLSEEACLAKLAELETSVAAMTATEEPTFDITPFLPIILKLIELWLSRRGG